MAITYGRKSGLDFPLGSKTTGITTGNTFQAKTIYYEVKSNNPSGGTESMVALNNDGSGDRISFFRRGSGNASFYIQNEGGTTESDIFLDENRVNKVIWYWNGSKYNLVVNGIVSSTNITKPLITCRRVELGSVGDGSTGEGINGEIFDVKVSSKQITEEQAIAITTGLDTETVSNENSEVAYNGFDNPTASPNKGTKAGFFDLVLGGVSVVDFRQIKEIHAKTNFPPDRLRFIAQPGGDMQGIKEDTSFTVNTIYADVNLLNLSGSTKFLTTYNTVDKADLTDGIFLFDPRTNNIRFRVGNVTNNFITGKPFPGQRVKMIFTYQNGRYDLFIDGDLFPGSTATAQLILDTININYSTVSGASRNFEMELFDMRHSSKSLTIQECDDITSGAVDVNSLLNEKDCEICYNKFKDSYTLPNNSYKKGFTDKFKLISGNENLLYAQNESIRVVETKDGGVFKKVFTSERADFGKTELVTNGTTSKATAGSLVFQTFSTIFLDWEWYAEDDIVSNVYFSMSPTNNDYYMNHGGLGNSKIELTAGSATRTRTVNTFAKGVPHKVCAVHNNVTGKFELFVDGVKEALELNDASKFSSLGLAIGYRQSANANWYAGKFRIVAVADTSITEQEAIDLTSGRVPVEDILNIGTTDIIYRDFKDPASLPNTGSIAGWDLTGTDITIEN